MPPTPPATPPTISPMFEPDTPLPPPLFKPPPVDVGSESGIDLVDTLEASLFGLEVTRLLGAYSSITRTSEGSDKFVPVVAVDSVVVGDVLVDVFGGCTVGRGAGFVVLDVATTCVIDTTDVSV